MSQRGCAYRVQPKGCKKGQGKRPYPEMADVVRAKMMAELVFAQDLYPASQRVWGHGRWQDFPAVRHPEPIMKRHCHFSRANRVVCRPLLA